MYAVKWEIRSKIKHLSAKPLSHRKIMPVCLLECSENKKILKGQQICFEILIFDVFQTEEIIC